MAGDLLGYLPSIVGSTIAVTALSAGAGWACVPALQRRLLPSPKESLLSELLPFDFLAQDQETLVCKDGTLCKIIELQGLDYTTKTEEEKDALLNSRKLWLDALAREEVRFQVVTLRQPVMPTRGINKADFKNPVLTSIEQRWSQQFEQTFINRHFVILSSKPHKKKAHKSQLQQEWRDLTQLMLDYLSAYKPRVLRESETESGLYAFWTQLINGFDHPLAKAKDHLSERMVSSTLHFHSNTGTIEWIDGPYRQYGAVLSIQAWANSLSETLFNELYALPCAFRLVHWLKGHSTLNALKTLEYGSRQASLAFFNPLIQEQFDTAINWVQAGEASYYEIQTSLFLTSENPEHLKAMVEEVRRIFRNQGLKPSLETQATETLWLSQLPSFNTILRPNYLFSQNIANLLSFQKEQTGVEHSDWGEGPLRLFKTSTGGAYAFQLHVSERKEEIAHSLILAPSGSGKTTLFQHLIGGALRHQNLRAYIFDRFSGTRIFTEAVGGKVIDLGDTEALALNPLQCADTKANRAFLLQFLLQLSDTQDDHSMMAAGRAIEAIFELPEEARILSSIYEAAIDTGSPLKRSLQKWVGDTSQARWFNGAQDSLDIQRNRLVTFEMAALEGDPLAYAAMLTYVMHRIREQVREHALPHLIFIDESAPMLQNALFRDYVKQLFREHRKLRGSISVCFQDPSAILNSGIQDTILSQCQTVFIFPNPNAQREDFAPFGLTEDQWAFVKGTSKHQLKHGVLIKRNTPHNPTAVILDIDLKGLGPYLKLYASGTESVNLVKQLQEQFGKEHWLPHYLGEI